MADAGFDAAIRRIAIAAIDVDFKAEYSPA
jgi:hypothetical protein